MRGNTKRSGTVVKRVGITPHMRGTLATRLDILIGTWDHPCTCGEHLPRVQDFDKARDHPAHAGNT